MKRLKLDGQRVKISEGVPILHEVPRALEFHMKYFLEQKPVLIRNAVKHWRALRKWSRAFFNSLLGKKIIDVEARSEYFPNQLVKDKAGYEHFVWPMRKEIIMRQFLKQLDESSGPIMNISSNMVDCFPELLVDIDLDSLNFITDSWDDAALIFNIEDGRSVSDLQINNSENIYAVISGYKDFVLVPPFQQQFVPVHRYPTATYKEDGNRMYFERQMVYKEAVEKEWVPLDALKPDLQAFPEYGHCTPLEVRVEAGSLLYLPRHYYQHIRQSNGCISINAHFESDPFEFNTAKIQKQDTNEKLQIKPFGCF